MCAALIADVLLGSGEHPLLDVDVPGAPDEKLLMILDGSNNPNYTGAPCGCDCVKQCVVGVGACALFATAGFRAMVGFVACVEQCDFVVTSKSE